LVQAEGAGMRLPGLQPTQDDRTSANPRRREHAALRDSIELSVRNRLFKGVGPFTIISGGFAFRSQARNEIRGMPRMRPPVSFGYQSGNGILQ